MKMMRLRRTWMCFLALSILPLGIVFDLTHTGWVGAVKDVVAAKN